MYMTGILDVKRYALVMGQRAGPGTEADSDDEILPAPLLRDEVDSDDEILPAPLLRDEVDSDDEILPAPLLRDEVDSDDEILPAPLLRDEVDDLVAAWRAQRPDLDVEPMQVLSRISRLARHLDIARRGAFAEHGLESWEFDVLSALRRQGPPFQLTPGALLRATLVTSGTMTNRIDRLAAAELVRREPDPTDKRGVLVTLTDLGQARVDAALAGLLRRERMLLAGLDAGERQHLADLMRILLVPFDAAE